MNESDPSGKSPHDSGAKLDQGKNRVALVLGAFAHALWAVSEVGTFGANKYSDNGWQTVENGPARYEDAQLRHWLKQHMDEEYDADSDLTHLAHEAWNALARLEYAIADQKSYEKADQKAYEKFAKRNLNLKVKRYGVDNPEDSQ